MQNRYLMLEVESAELEPVVQVQKGGDKKGAAPAGKDTKPAGKPQADRAPRGSAPRNAAPAPAGGDDAAPPRRRDDRGAPRTGGKGGKGSRNGNRPPKHDQDRQSYQQRTTEKRENNGPGSWGKPEEAAGAVEVEGGDASPAEAPKRAPRVLTAEEEEAAALARKEREEEEKQMTLEEYRVQQQAKTSRELPKERKPNEGSEDKAFANKATLLAKAPPEEEDFFKITKKTDAKPTKATATKEAKPKKEAEKVLFEPKSYSEESRDSRRNERSTAPRDGARTGGAPRGGPRPARGPKAAPPPAVDDDAFPTLGGKK